jgi:acetylornithine/succinyldiaminopimelate/putrescine aminotransferase
VRGAGEQLFGGLRELQGRLGTGVIGDVRGSGLMIGLEFGPGARPAPPLVHLFHPPAPRLLSCPARRCLGAHRHTPALAGARRELCVCVRVRV